MTPYAEPVTVDLGTDLIEKMDNISFFQVKSLQLFSTLFLENCNQKSFG